MLTAGVQFSSCNIRSTLAHAEVSDVPALVTVQSLADLGLLHPKNLQQAEFGRKPDL